MVFGNTDLDIDLGAPFLGPAPNDPGDGDAVGGNYMQNYPVLTYRGVRREDGRDRHAEQRGRQPFLVQFFADTACNPLGHGGGKYVLGTDGADERHRQRARVVHAERATAGGLGGDGDCDRRRPQHVGILGVPRRSVTH